MTHNRQYGNLILSPRDKTMALTEQDIKAQLALNNEIHYSYGPNFKTILAETVADCPLALEDLIKAIKAHLPNVYKGQYANLVETMGRRLDSCLDFDYIPVHYNTLDYIGGVCIMAAEGNPDEKELRKVELICSSFQNDDHYPECTTINSELR